jgi:hypothetical protein
MLPRGCILPEDLDVFQVTDDPAEAVEHIRRRLHAVAEGAARRRDNSGSN